MRWTSSRTAWVLLIAVWVVAFGPAYGQDGAVLTNLENGIANAAAGWETTIMQAARSLFWILAGIEVGIAAVWLAIQGASLDNWFGELVRRILFIGFFVFVLEQGPTFGRAIVDSLFQIGSSGGSASPVDVFNAGIAVASDMSHDVRFGLFEDNALAIAAVFAMIVVVICFALVAAIFVAVMVEMYVGLLAGMIMLGLGGSSFTKDFAVRYLVYAFSVGMKLMALVMIARIGSEVLIEMADASSSDDKFLTSLAIAGIAVVVFMISIYVPAIIQGVIQGVSITNGGETLRPTFGSAQFGAGVAAMGATAMGAGGRAAAGAFEKGGFTGAAAAGSAAMASTAMRGLAATASAVKDQAIGGPGSFGTTTMGLANAKLAASDARAKPSSSGQKAGKP
ncbi:P-type conjugative transfer protein TrbL [Novosphingobium resinovorum]|uniref:P-type conjugative transfer protein TrbL n=1 Tax=Novosphingobium resinovorum TaxID=158500 RepID=A0A1D8AGE9_9SPHN|nr:P-type conjugative transfer protein TrbL [Novosphingobium resinovorum]AOR81192.1 P-type conjugative transfer protein TrbL [Novosphingobium resinovorum]